LAIYRFARVADDIADEGTAGSQQRLAELAAYRQDLLQLFAGRATSARWPQVFAALGQAKDRHSLPLPPLLALLEAFAHDAPNPRYDTRSDLLWYCERSANPVGRLLLHLYGLQDEQALAQSDQVCTALQLINFWQDLSVDLPRQRLYLPESELRQCGLGGELLLQTPPLQLDSSSQQRLQSLVGELCLWARSLMLGGAALALRVPGRAGWELRLVVQGGLRVLEKINDMQHRTWLAQPRLGVWDLPVMLWRAWRMTAHLPAATSHR
jgi:hydroxysqualene synthase